MGKRRFLDGKKDRRKAVLGGKNVMSSYAFLRKDRPGLPTPLRSGVLRKASGLPSSAP